MLSPWSLFHRFADSGTPGLRTPKMEDYENETVPSLSGSKTARYLLLCKQKAVWGLMSTKG